MPDENTKFVNSLYIKNLIENYYQENDVKIKGYSVEPASPGDGPTGRSSMNRVLIKYTSRESPSGSLSLVMKLKPTKGELSKYCQNSDSFLKEQTVYNKVVPEILNELKPIAGKLEFVPEIIASATQPMELMVFEDLTLRGYSTENVVSGLNYDQSKMALEKLAFFHATSAVLLEKNSDLFSLFSKGTFDASHRSNLNYFPDVVREMARAATGSSMEQNLKNKLNSLPSKVIQRGIQAYQAGPREFKVLNHGDFWTNNILFKYENGQLVDALFIDFQNSVVGSPIIDLVYFLTTSVACDIYFSKRDELIFIYHETLKLILDKLGYKGAIPSLNELQVELLKKGSLEVIYTLSVAPFLRSKSKIVPAIQPEFYDDKLDVDEVKKIFKEMEFGLGMQLKAMDEKGLLDWGAAESKVKGLMGCFQR